MPKWALSTHVDSVGFHPKGVLSPCWHLPTTQALLAKVNIDRGRQLDVGIVSFTQGKNIVGREWIDKTKYGVDGYIDKHKARLVVLRSRQSHYGFNFLQVHCYCFFKNDMPQILNVLWIK